MSERLNQEQLRTLFASAADDKSIELSRLAQAAEDSGDASSKEGYYRDAALAQGVSIGLRAKLTTNRLSFNDHDFKDIELWVETEVDDKQREPKTMLELIKSRRSDLLVSIIDIRKRALQDGATLRYRLTGVFDEGEMRIVDDEIAELCAVRNLVLDLVSSKTVEDLLERIRLTHTASPNIKKVEVK